MSTPEITKGTRVLVPGRIRTDEPKHGEHAVVITDGKLSHHSLDVHTAIPLAELREVLTDYREQAPDIEEHYDEYGVMLGNWCKACGGRDAHEPDCWGEKQRAKADALLSKLPPEDGE